GEWTDGRLGQPLVGHDHRPAAARETLHLEVAHVPTRLELRAVLRQLVGLAAAVRGEDGGGDAGPYADADGRVAPAVAGVRRRRGRGRRCVCLMRLLVR